MIETHNSRQIISVTVTEANFRVRVLLLGRHNEHCRPAQWRSLFNGTRIQLASLRPTLSPSDPHSPAAADEMDHLTSAGGR